MGDKNIFNHANKSIKLKLVFALIFFIILSLIFALTVLQNKEPLKLLNSKETLNEDLLLKQLTFRSNIDFDIQKCILNASFGQGNMIYHFANNPKILLKEHIKRPDSFYKVPLPISSKVKSFRAFNRSYSIAVCNKRLCPASLENKALVLNDSNTLKYFILSKSLAEQTKINEIVYDNEKSLGIKIKANVQMPYILGLDNDELILFKIIALDLDKDGTLEKIAYFKNISFFVSDNKSYHIRLNDSSLYFIPREEKAFFKVEPLIKVGKKINKGDIFTISYLVPIKHKNLKINMICNNKTLENFE